jgi:endo-1,4-beta-D-glucanase Y
MVRLPLRRHLSFSLVVVALGCAASSCAKDPGGGTGEPNLGAGGAPTGTGAAASGGSGGSRGSGGASAPGKPVMKDPSSYPNSAGARYPYPQGHALAHCALPAYNTDSVALAFANWKTKFFQGGRVVRPATDPGADPAHPNDTVSEGIAYGMLIAVYMNDRTMFDALWSYASPGRLDSNGLMNWRYDSNGGMIQGGSAADADEDIAWALLMAGAQWGAATYTTAATTMINAIWDHEVDTGGGTVLKPGDNFGGAGQTNPSYFAPSYYRAFAKVTPAHDWMALVTSSYATLAAASGSLGLVPNWSNSAGQGVNGPNNDTSGPAFGYDACRTPWRIALDWCENGAPEARTYLDKIVAFYQQQAPTSVGTLKDGYTTAGGNPAGVLGDYSAGMSFFGPAGVAAMAGGHDAFADLVYRTLISNSTTSLMSFPGVYTYFAASWGVLSLVTMSGNFWNLAAASPP